MLKRIAFVMMCLSLLGVVVTAAVVIQRLGPILHMILW